MSEHFCSHPTCYAHVDTATMYREHSEHGSFTVCGEHADLTKDGITVLSVAPADEVELR